MAIEDKKDGNSSIKRKSRRPKYSRFSQQELPACKPILTPGWVVSIFITIGIIFIPIGFSALFASQRVAELAFQYDKECVPPQYANDMVTFIQSNDTNKACTKKLTVDQKMKAPIFVYYQLDHYFQNHRRYVKSRSDPQLMSVSKQNDSIDDCVPERYTSSGQTIVPCGLIAWSLFNDTYKFSVEGRALGVSKKDITWKSDREKRFSSNVYPKNFQSEGLIGGAKLNSSIPLSQQDDLIVWMRTAALPEFRKLYGKIEEDLEANDEVTVVIKNNYNTYSFNGSKTLILSTASWIGGRNSILGIAYLTVGGICLLLALLFILLYVIKPRPIGDTSYLSWNRGAPGGHFNY